MRHSFFIQNIEREQVASTLLIRLFYVESSTKFTGIDLFSDVRVKR